MSRIFVLCTNQYRSVGGFTVQRKKFAPFHFVICIIRFLLRSLNKMSIVLIYIIFCCFFASHFSDTANGHPCRARGSRFKGYRASDLCFIYRFTLPNLFLVLYEIFSAAGRLSDQP